MPGLFIFTSNRMERLIERLAELVRKPLRSPLVPETIVVQSRGMERWVSMNLARINGICANVRFPFPNAFLEEAFSRLHPELHVFQSVDQDELTFQIMKYLPGHLDHPDFEGLRVYLEDDCNHFKLYQLCRKLAYLFDQYSVFRQDMLMRWQQGKDVDPIQRWQARLWLELAEKVPGIRRAAHVRSSLDILEMAPGATRLPERVSLFGISYLPPLYLQSFEQLSRLLRVNLFLMNPCREYWAEILSDDEVQRLERHEPRIAETAEAFHLERGNRLLSSCGALGRDFFGLIAASSAVQEEIFEEPEGDSVLSRLHSDILNLRDRGLGPAAGQESALPVDASIQIHSCHSPMREIEVLHDQILAMFAENPELLPTDIIIMTPDIKVYAAYISAVFGSQADDSRFIPFGIADWTGAGQGLLETVLFSLLELKSSRLGASEVLRLLEFEPVRRKFNIADSDRIVIERWVRQAGIRWGEDENSRIGLGLPALDQNTWKAGIERLLLGYAMPSREADLFQGILAFDPMEGGETRILGNLLEFADKVFELTRQVRQPKTLGQWKAVLTRVLDDFCALDEDLESGRLRIRRAINEVGRLEQAAEFDRAVALEVVLKLLMSRLENESVGRGFLSGGVTFCAMLPMRAIPFKVVCLVGMNYDAFPREQQPLTFDLIGRRPRPGDRSRRNDDKYLFLEAVLAARRKLYISFVGQSIQDNTRLPPSVLVSELIDTLQNEFHFPASAAGGSALITEHRLQGFSRAYFRAESGLFSYSRDDLMACSAADQRREPEPFFRNPLELKAQEATEWKQITLERLNAFFFHPARFLVQQRLGIHLEEEVEALQECEPFLLDPLVRYRIGDSLLQRCLAGHDPIDLLPVFRAAGDLPHAGVGDHLFARLSAEVEHFAAKARRILPPPALEPLEIDCELDGFRLGARFTSLSAHGCVHMRFAELTARDFLKFWLGHLFLCLGQAIAGSPRSLLIGKNAAWVLGPVGGCRRILAYLLALYWRGLQAPIHFFPGASWEYAQKRLTPGGQAPRALASARRRWSGSGQFPGESADPYNRLCHGTADPLDEEFQLLSAQVFRPLIEQAEQVPW